MHHLHIVRSQNLSGLALEQARDEVMRIYGHHLETEVEPFWDYLRAVRPKDTDELDVPAESEVKFNYGPETQWTKEKYIRLWFKLRRHWYTSETWDDLFCFLVRCLPWTMGSHHQNMSRLIAEWRYQQEKGLTWKEWAKGILDRWPIEGAPWEGTDLNRQGLGCPESTILGWYPPMLEDVLIPPEVSASSGLLEEGHQQTPDHGPNQGNWHLPNVQPNTPVSWTSMPEDRQTEEWQRAVQAVRDITTGQPTPTLKENQMYDWDGQFDETLGLPIQLRNRVSDPGTPPVRASPRAPRHDEGVGGATVNMGVGSDYTRLPKIQEETVRGKPRNCLPSEEKVGLFPPHHSLDLEKPKLLKAR